MACGSSLLTRDQTQVPLALEVWSLSHWVTRGVPTNFFLLANMLLKAVHCQHSPLLKSGWIVGPQPLHRHSFSWCAALLLSHQSSDKARPEGTWKPSIWPERLAWFAAASVPNCCYFRGEWISKMKPLLVPAWSWKILASHVFSCFSSKTGFHKWSCNFYLLAPQLSNFAAWIHSCCKRHNTPSEAGIDPWTHPSQVNFMPWYSVIAHSLKSNPSDNSSESSSEKSACAVVLLLAHSEHDYWNRNVGTLKSCS